MTVRLKIRGPGEPRKPKAGTPERNKTGLKNYPPFRGIFIAPGIHCLLCGFQGGVFAAVSFSFVIQSIGIKDAPRSPRIADMI